MKPKFFFLVSIFVFIGFNATAQRGLKIAYVDMDYILANVPEYQEASTQLDAKIQEWKAEIELKRQEIEAMEQNLENERPLLTEDLIEERLAEIQFEKEKLLEYQQKRFGPTGDMIVMKRQLVKPVQDQVFSAIQEIGRTREYDFIFENSSDALMLYSADRHDISDQVLNMIQRSSRKSTREQAQKEEKEPEAYKSVTKAKDDQKEEATRQAELNQREQERQAKIDARQHRMDSLKAVREAAYQARKEEMLEKRAERKRIRDSIRRVREEKRNKVNTED